MLSGSLIYSALLLGSLDPQACAASIAQAAPKISTVQSLNLKPFKDPRWARFDKRGVPLVEAEVVDDMLHGSYIERNYKGETTLEGSYHQGKKHGLFKHYRAKRGPRQVYVRDLDQFEVYHEGTLISRYTLSSQFVRESGEIRLVKAKLEMPGNGPADVVIASHPRIRHLEEVLPKATKLNAEKLFLIFFASKISETALPDRNSIQFGIPSQEQKVIIRQLLEKRFTEDEIKILYQNSLL